MTRVFAICSLLFLLFTTFDLTLGGAEERDFLEIQEALPLEASGSPMPLSILHRWKVRVDLSQLGQNRPIALQFGEDRLVGTLRQKPASRQGVKIFQTHLTGKRGEGQIWIAEVNGRIYARLQIQDRLFRLQNDRLSEIDLSQIREHEDAP